VVFKNPSIPNHNRWYLYKIPIYFGKVNFSGKMAQQQAIDVSKSSKRHRLCSKPNLDIYLQINAFTRFFSYFLPGNQFFLGITGK